MDYRYDELNGYGNEGRIPVKYLSIITPIKLLTPFSESGNT